MKKSTKKPKKKRTANRRKHPVNAQTRVKSAAVFVCHECGKVINAREAYTRCPITGRRTSSAWCTECYERVVTRTSHDRVKQPRAIEKIA